MAGGIKMNTHLTVLVLVCILAGISTIAIAEEMILQAPGVEEQITSGSGNDVTPRIDGNYITWVQWIYGDADVYYYSINGKLEERVTSANGNQINPDISGNYIVWEDDRSGKANVWVYDITTMTEARVGDQGTYQRNPAISDHSIVWEDYRNTMDPDIYMYIIGQGQEYPICTAPGRQINPDISGNYIVWEDYRYCTSQYSENSEIFLYDIEQGIEYQVTHDLNAQKNPRIDGNNIVWEDWRNTNVDIYSTDVSSLKERQVTFDKTDDTEPDISKNIVTYTHSDSKGKKDIYMINLQDTVTQSVCVSTGDQAYSSISVDRVVWQDDRNGINNNDIYLYTLKEETPYPPYQFYGNSYIDGMFTPVGTVITAWVGGTEVGRTTTTTEGQYGNGGYSKRLVVPVDQSMLGKQISFRTDELKAKETVLITENGGIYPLDLTFTYSEPITPCEFFGEVTIDGVPAYAGTKITAKIDDEVRGQITTREVGRYGGPASNDPRLKVPIYTEDIGRTITFWIDDRRADTTFFIEEGGIFDLDLVFTQTPIINDYQFYGYTTIMDTPAPVGTVISALIDGEERGRITTIVEGAYGGPYTDDDRLVVPISASDLGKTIYFWSDGMVAEETYVIGEIPATEGCAAQENVTQDGAASDCNIIIRQDLNFVESTGIAADFFGSPQSGTAPLTVQFSDLSTGNPTMWHWDFGDGGTEDMLGSPTHTYKADGVYTVSLTASNQYGDSDTEIKSQYISVCSTTGIVANFVGEPQSGTAPLTVQFTDLSTGSPTMWHWDFGDGRTEDMLGSPSHTYLEDGVYTVSLTASNQYGDSDTEVKSQYISVGSTTGIVANFIGEPQSGTAPLTVQFTDLSTGSPTMWNWDFGDGGTEGMLGNPSHTYETDGLYTVSLTASNQYGDSDEEVKCNYISVGTPTDHYISLYPGWNCVATPRWLAEGYDTAAIFNAVDVDGHSIYQYDAEQGIFRSLGEESPIVPLDAVWIYSAKMDKVYLTFDEGSSVVPQKALYKGWNSVGFIGLEPISAKTTFVSVSDSWIYCLLFDPIEQTYRETIVKDFNDSTALTPYQGCWLFMDKDGILTDIYG